VDSLFSSAQLCFYNAFAVTQSRAVRLQQSTNALDFLFLAVSAIFCFFFVSCDNDLQDQYCKLDDYSCLVVKQLRHLHATGASFSSIFGFMRFSFLSQEPA